MSAMGLHCSWVTCPWDSKTVETYIYLSLITAWLLLLMIKLFICASEVTNHLEIASKQIIHTSKKDINHLERIQRAATRWVKGLRGLTYEERLQALKLQPLGKRRQRNYLVLQKARTKKSINKTASSNRKNPQKTKQFCVQGCSKLEPFAILSRIGNRAAQIQTTIRLICLLINISLYSIFAPLWFFWALCPFPISKYI